MKLIIFTFICLISWLGVSAQRLVYNEKAPTINMSTPYYGDVPKNSLPVLIEFITTEIPNIKDHLSKVDLLAKSDKSINVVVVVNGSKESVDKLLNETDYKFTVIYDVSNVDNYFTWYDVRYIPKSVVLDVKGNFIWQGKFSQFSSTIIRNSLPANKNKK